MQGFALNVLAGGPIRKMAQQNLNIHKYHPISIDIRPLFKTR